MSSPKSISGSTPHMSLGQTSEVYQKTFDKWCVKSLSRFHALLAADDLSDAMDHVGWQIGYAVVLASVMAAYDEPLA